MGTGSFLYGFIFDIQRDLSSQLPVAVACRLRLPVSMSYGAATDSGSINASVNVKGT